MRTSVVFVVGWIVGIAVSIALARRNDRKELPYFATASGLLVAALLAGSLRIGLETMLPSWVAFPVAVMLFLPACAGWTLLVGRLALVPLPYWRTPTTNDLVGAHALVYFHAGLVACAVAEERFALTRAGIACWIIGTILGVRWAWMKPTPA